jgi:endo-1,4-beta-xylanase
MKVRGHVLLWEPENPEWLTSGNFNSEQMQEILRVHIQTIVSRYSGKVWAWDIANVVLDGNSGLADNIWLRTIGPDYLDLAFQYAHEADPNALLFLNEGNRPAGTAMDPIIIYLQDMINRGVPIDGVGLSMHVDINQSNTSVSDLALNMSRLNSLGLLVTVSEVDVQIHPTTAYPTPEELNLQAHIYRDIVESCLTAPNCPSITIWGLADSYSNLLVVENIDDAPLLFDVNFQPKPAYYAVLEALQANP